MINVIKFPTEDYDSAPEPSTKEVRADRHQNIITSFTMDLYVSENSEGGITIYSDNESPYRSGIPNEEYAYDINNNEFNNWLKANKFIP